MQQYTAGYIKKRIDILVLLEYSMQIEMRGDENQDREVKYVERDLYYI